MSSHGGAGGSDGQVDGDGGSAPDAGDSGAAAAAPVTRALTALETPVFLRGEVVHGFGRGSKMLGIPTANLPDDVVKEEAGDVPAGVYFGWAAVGDKPKAYKAVMSVGWNPHFKNTKKTVEPHLLHEFEEDFYGEELRLLICGHLRDEAAFSSLESLLEAIHEDIRVASDALDSPPYASLADDARLGEAASVAADAADRRSASDGVADADPAAEGTE